MTFKKELKKWGNNLVIVFTQEEERVNNLKVGDIIEGEFTDDFIQNKGGKRR